MFSLNKKTQNTPQAPKEAAENPPKELARGTENPNPSPQQTVSPQKTLEKSVLDYSEASSEEGQPSTEPDHFDELIASETKAEQAQQAQVATAAMLGPNEFHAVFCVGFSTASHMTGLKSLEVNKDDAAAQNCTRALYETIQDIPLLHFLLQPQNKWFERAIAIGAFAVPMAAAVSAEIEERNAAPQEEQKPATQQKAKAGQLDISKMSLREMADEQYGKAA